MSRPTVVYVGNFGDYPNEPILRSTENDVAEAFEHLGWDVVRMQEEHSSTSTVWSIASDADLLLWTASPNDEAHNPYNVRDMVHDLAKQGVPSAAYHLDTFWVTSRGGRRWWRNGMFLMGDVFTADGDHQAEWDRLGVRHHWLRPGVRESATELGTPRAEYLCDVALVGSNGRGYHEDVWTYRRELVDQLRRMCDRRGWSWRNPGGEAQPWHPEGKIDRGTDMNDFYASARVTIGDSLCPLKERSRYWSDRAYEAPGRGGFLVMPQIDVLQHEDYDDRLPMYPWGDWEKLEAIVEYFLDNDDMREEIARDTHAIAVDRHTYVNRAETILETVIA